MENNESNEFPFVLELHESDPLFSSKLRLLNIDKAELTKKTIRVQENFTEQTSIELFSYLRFIVYNGELDLLLNVK